MSGVQGTLEMAKLDCCICVDLSIKQFNLSHRFYSMQNTASITNNKVWDASLSFRFFYGNYDIQINGTPSLYIYHSTKVVVSLDGFSEDVRESVYYSTH